MVTNIQVRAVEDELAAAAKRRADETHRSLSAYVRDLIAADVEQASADRAMQALLDEIAERPPWPRVDPAEVLAAVRQARADMGIE